MYDVILVPTDGSEASRHAAEEAFRIARATGATVHAVYVIDESASSLLLADRSMADLLETLTEEGEDAVGAIADHADGVEVVTDVIRGMRIHEAVLDYAAEHGADLIVMGTHGRQGIEHLLGSTTERVTAQSSIPVLVVSENERTD